MRPRLHGNPALLSLQEIIARNEAGYELAKKSYVPEIMITGAYGQREDKDRLYEHALMLPPFWWGSMFPYGLKANRAGRLPKRTYMVEQAKAEYKAMANEIRYQNQGYPGQAGT